MLISLSMCSFFTPAFHKISLIIFVYFLSKCALCSYHLSFNRIGMAVPIYYIFFVYIPRISIKSYRNISIWKIFLDWSKGIIQIVDYSLQSSNMRISEYEECETVLFLCINRYHFWMIIEYSSKVTLIVSSQMKRFREAKPTSKYFCNLHVHFLWQIDGRSNSRIIFFGKCQFKLSAARF